VEGGEKRKNASHLLYDSVVEGKKGGERQEKRGRKKEGKGLKSGPPLISTYFQMRKEVFLKGGKKRGKKKSQGREKRKGKKVILDGNFL